MHPHDWSFFKLRVPVRSNIETIYKAWATTEGLENWFLRKAVFTKDGEEKERTIFVEVNDSYEWLWHGWSDDTVERGTILQANGKDSLQFSFGKAGNVTVTIKKEQEEMIVELVQDEIPVDEEGQAYYHIGCTKGWVFYLTNLKSILESGIDLRNKNVELKDVINS
jgi:uncharacterized protein YndB with AHSA1/START domain